MIIICPKCGAKNRVPDSPQPSSNYRCGKCHVTIPSGSEAQAGGDLEFLKMESPKDLVNMGKKFYKRGEIEQAIKYYDKAIKIDQSYSDAWSNKAEALEKNKELNGALECCAMALKDRGKALDLFVGPDLLEMKGRILRKLGRLDEALKCYDSFSTTYIVQLVILTFGIFAIAYWVSGPIQVIFGFILIPLFIRAIYLACRHFYTRIHLRRQLARRK